MSITEIRSMTRRELSLLIDSMVSRKQGYPETEATVKVKTTDEIRDKIQKAHEKRFGKVTNG